MSIPFSKYRAATGIAIIFHVIGITGLLFFDRDFFIRSTALNLLLMLVLLIWTQPGKNIYFWLFLFACFTVGLAVEITGVNTGLLFGNYHYGNVLGFQFLKVPLIIGVNWFIVIYCSGIAMHTLLMNIMHKMPYSESARPRSLKTLSIIIDGATLAVFFDWLMEPVAIKLNYWKWEGSSAVPWFNYFCWFMVSVLLLIVFRFCKFEKRNKFAVNLLLVQLMFFLLLRVFLD